VSSKKYFPDKEEIGIIEEIYDGSTIRINKIMRLLGGKYPRWYIRRLATQMGLARVKEPNWSEIEINWLHKNFPRKGWSALQSGLRRINGGQSRSRTAIQLKAKRESLNKRSDGFTLSMLMVLLGVDHHKIHRWLSLGLIEATRKGTDRKEVQGGDMWHFTEKDIRKFIINYPEEIDLRRVEKYTFIDLLAARM
jgi:hypothetical protein